MKTQYIKMIIYILFGFANLTAKGQIIIDTLTSQYYNDFNKATQIIEEITITNNTEEDYLTWISQFPITEKPNNVIIHRFFFSRPGDFRFFDLMYDDVSFAHGIPHDIPFSFIKKIQKNESFTYILLKENKESNFYDERIVVISRKEVEDYLKVKVKEEFFSPQSSIFLYDKPTGKDNSERDTSSQITDPSNQLNQFILKSVCSYVKDYNAFAKRVNYDTIRYICADGLPVDFPFDSLPCPVHTLRWMEVNHHQIKREINNGVTVAEVETKLNGNVVDITVSIVEVRRLRKRQIQEAHWPEGGWKQYRYSYSCDDNKWIPINCNE